MKTVLLCAALLLGSQAGANAMLLEPIRLNTLGDYDSYVNSRPFLIDESVFWNSYEVSYQEDFLPGPVYFKFDGIEKSLISEEEFQTALNMPQEPQYNAVWSEGSIIYVSDGLGGIEEYDVGSLVTNLRYSGDAFAWNEFGGDHIMYAAAHRATAPEPLTLTTFGMAAMMAGIMRGANSRRIQNQLDVS